MCVEIAQENVPPPRPPSITTVHTTEPQTKRPDLEVPLSSMEFPSKGVDRWPPAWPFRRRGTKEERTDFPKDSPVMACLRRKRRHPARPAHVGLSADARVDFVPGEGGLGKEGFSYERTGRTSPSGTAANEVCMCWADLYTLILRQGRSCWRRFLTNKRLSTASIGVLCRSTWATVLCL